MVDGAEAFHHRPSTTYYLRVNSSPNVLYDLHRQAEAEFQAYGDLEIVSTFGEPPAEYSAIRKGCGLMDLPYRGLLELTGEDRLPFLNNLLSNQTFDKQTKTPLAAGKGVYAFLLNAKSGRIIADINVIERGDRTLLDLDVRLIETVRQTLERYQFAEQVKIAVKTDSLHQIALHGPGGAAVLQQAAGAEVALQPGESTSVSLFGQEAIVWRDDPAEVPGHMLIVAADSARAIWMELLSRFGAVDQLGKRTLRPIGWAAFNATRIEAGRPIFGIDFDDTILPHETGLALERAVSFVKGCYPGQEIVARMHARQQVARKIAGIRLEGDALPIAGTKILDQAGNEIGGVTSSTISPILSNSAIALALLKKPHFAVGTTVRVPAEGEIRTATVVELPFLKRPSASV
jgi:folate-binding protein YgfZ